MWNRVNQVLNQSANRTVDAIANFLPGLLALILVLVGTVIVAWIVRLVVLHFLRTISFDRRADLLGLSPLLGWSRSHSPSLLVARLCQWALLVVGLLIGLSALNVAVTSQVAMLALQYLPHVAAAALILLAGHLAARFLARSVLISAVNMQIHSARLLSLGVKWLVMVLAAAMALEHLGIGRQIVLVSFSILFGGIVLAMALAVGLGSKDMITRSLERQLRGDTEEREEIHHL